VRAKNKINQNAHHALYIDANDVCFNVRNKKCIPNTTSKKINAVISCCVHCVNNIICGKYNNKILTPLPPGGRGCSYIFYLKEKFGVARKKK